MRKIQVLETRAYLITERDYLEAMTYDKTADIKKIVSRTAREVERFCDDMVDADCISDVEFPGDISIDELIAALDDMIDTTYDAELELGF